jgi:hypothetical protein
MNERTRQNHADSGAMIVCIFAVTSAASLLRNKLISIIGNLGFSITPSDDKNAPIESTGKG